MGDLCNLSRFLIKVGESTTVSANPDTFVLVMVDIIDPVPFQRERIVRVLLVYV